MYVKKGNNKCRIKKRNKINKRNTKLKNKNYDKTTLYIYVHWNIISKIYRGI